jgi:hypothetical protein
MVVEVEDPVHLGHEVGVVGRFPGGGRLEGDVVGAQDPPDRFATHGGDLLAGEVGGELDQAPAGERQPESVGVGLGQGDDFLPGRLIRGRGPTPAPFWVQCVEPPLVERVDHVADVAVVDL